MSAYEFRFLNARGGMLLLYYAHCTGDDDARTRVAIADDIEYSRFEIWQDDRKVDAGRNGPYLM